MKRFFWKLFPKRTESMPAFIDFVLRNRCKRVEVASLSDVVNSPGTAGFFVTDIYPEIDVICTEYRVQCVAVAPSGERMVYSRLRVTRCVSQYEYAVDHERCALDVFFAAEKCAAMLKQKLATVTVDLLGVSRMPVTCGMREEMRRRAEEYGVTPPWGHP